MVIINIIDGVPATLVNALRSFKNYQSPYLNQYPEMQRNKKSFIGVHISKVQMQLTTRFATSNLAYRRYIEKVFMYYLPGCLKGKSIDLLG